MGLFVKKKVSGACACGGKCAEVDAKDARFIVLGACCKRSLQTFENAKTAIADLGLDHKVVNIGDNIEISKYGVMQTPAFVIDGKVVAYGKLLSVEDIKLLVQNTVG